MSNKNLIWFNKEGDYLNFDYNNTSNIFEGDILFHENSNDTFKTYGLYMMEKIPSFDFELPGELTTRKFQLFNEKGLHLYGSKYKLQKVNKIEPVNNDPNFNSKWIYGDSFEVKFPIGTIIKFDTPIFEFVDSNRTYTVVSAKTNAIMIVSQMDNSTFDVNYFPDYDDLDLYTDIKISGINALGVYDYIDDNYASNLSFWNEQDFYDLYYIGKKVSIINSDLNDGVITVDNPQLTDQVHIEYFLNVDDLPQGSNLIIEVITKTDVPKIFSGNLVITDNSIILNNYPKILKPGIVFKIIGSQNNTNFVTVAPIPEWNGIVNETFFDIGSQVIFENNIYECIQSYTQSFGDINTSFINPLIEDFWGAPTYIGVEELMVNETINAQLYLTSDRYYFEYQGSTSSLVTLASSVERFKDDLSIFNIDLFFKEGLRADLVYPSNYAEVNFYYDNLNNSIGGSRQTFERLVGVEENINYELNYNFSENWKYNIVITDIDRFGLKITINGMVYDVEASIVFTGAVIDMERSIDRTLRNWLKRHYVTLYRLGINVDLRYSGSYNSIFYNSLLITSQYPNVPLVVNEILVGTTADFYVEHSDVNFYNIGPYFNININGTNYDIESVYLNDFDVDIPETLNKWVSEWGDTLSTFSIFVKSISNRIVFTIKRLDRRLDYTINTGLLSIPGVEDFKINRKIFGNHGMLVTSNEVILPDSSVESFISQGFSTGMVFSINNTMWTFVNQEYNILYLDDNSLNISYEGPFWGLSDSICNSSAFVTLAFDLGFNQEDCPEPPVPPTPGPFNQFEFSNDFLITFNPNTYDTNQYDLNIFQGTGNLVDLKYVQLSSCLYGFGESLVVLDAFSGEYIKTVELTGNTQSIEMDFNTTSDLIYLLSSNNIWIVDPITNELLHNISLTYNAYDISMNPNNGDVYVSYSNIGKVDIWSVSNFSNTPTYTINSTRNNWPGGITGTGKMVFNDFEGDMYITTDGDYVLRVNTTRDIQTTYQINNLRLDSIHYEPVNEGVYIYGDNLFKIDNGDTFSIDDIQSATFSDIIFNNINGQINISDSSNRFIRLNLDDSYFISNIGDYGYLTINQFDGDVYLSSQVTNKIAVIRNGVWVHQEELSAPTTKIIYNPERKSIWAIQPSTNSLVEVEVSLGSTIDVLIPSTSVGDNNYGTLDDNYIERPSIWLKTRDFVRRPRENFEGDVRVKYYWRWLTDDKPEFFMYDFSGDQLQKNGVYAYTGPKPLPEVVLNRKPNKNLDYVSRPEFQQTIFDKIEYDLSYLNDVDDITSEVEPIQLFLGFKSDNEGAFSSTLQLFKKEEIVFDIDSDNNINLTFKTEEIDGDRFGTITINTLSDEVFTDKGLKSGQKIVIYLKDLTNTRNQYTSDNTASIFIIRQVFSKILVLDFIKPTDTLFEENTVVTNYPSSNNTTYLRFTLKVADKELGRFNVMGQTEEEDERFKIELGNLGKLINPDEVFIFKNYDILEGGIDWTILNKKRKEMLMMKHLIYPYIGAYKSIINAINYFGYNDLQLNEYYRNIDPNSENFFKLFKVEIPDIFDNSIPGWEDNDFIKNTYPNDKFEETNLFNLTYRITDKDGNSVLNYSLDEVIIKLQGLKYWLKRNIIPLTHKIMDITGNAYFNASNSIQHKVHDIRIINIKQEMSPISFKLNEAYLMPVNSGSTVYNCVLDFYSILPNVGTERFYLLDEIKPFNGSRLELPEYFNVKVRTYKTYKEWAPFTTYNSGEKVIYFEKLYESVIDNNRIKNPRRYDSSTNWSANTDYKVATIVRYDRDYYVFSGLGLTGSTVSPNLDTMNWLKVTEWKEIDKEPVQTITEFRTSDNLLPFNFTIDSNLDPFLTIEVTSDNGYGQIYNDRKNYEIRGIKDLVSTDNVFDEIGPFEPIEPIFGPSCPDIIQISLSNPTLLIPSEIRIGDVKITKLDNQLTIVNNYYQFIRIGGENGIPFTDINPGTTFSATTSVVTSTGKIKIRFLNPNCEYCLDISSELSNQQIDCDFVIPPPLTCNLSEGYCYLVPQPECNLSEGYCNLI
jgi:hypothetical protein